MSKNSDCHQCLFDHGRVSIIKCSGCKKNIFHFFAFLKSFSVSHFKMDILQESEPPYKKKEDIVRFVTSLHSTLF